MLRQQRNLCFNPLIQVFDFNTNFDADFGGNAYGFNPLIQVFDFNDNTVKGAIIKLHPTRVLIP